MMPSVEAFFLFLEWVRLRGHGAVGATREEKPDRDDFKVRQCTIDATFASARSTRTLPFYRTRTHSHDMMTRF